MRESMIGVLSIVGYRIGVGHSIYFMSIAY